MSNREEGVSEVSRGNLVLPTWNTEVLKKLGRFDKMLVHEIDSQCVNIRVLLIRMLTHAL